MSRYSQNVILRHTLCRHHVSNATEIQNFVSKCTQQKDNGNHQPANTGKNPLNNSHATPPKALLLDPIIPTLAQNQQTGGSWGGSMIS
jgi:hypothetical protein